jgi:hypothetical protein
MANIENPLTDALNLVETTTVHGFMRIFTQTIGSEAGFSLELFHGGAHRGSISSAQFQQAAQVKQRFQALGARDGDTLYRVNLGPRMQLVQDTLRTRDGYTRDYSITVELQIIDPSQFIELYRQGADPVHLVILGIKEALQEYGDRTFYEKMQPANIQTQAKYAFDRERDNLRAGIRINRTYQPTLGVDKNYQPINLSPVLKMKGQLTTLEGNERDYEATIELEIIDPQEYKHLEYTGAAPLELARIAIDGELQRYARQEFYETLSELQLRDVAQHAFDNHPGKINNGLRVVRAHSFALGEDKNYRPINRSPLLTVSGKLTTEEGYARPYEVTVELEITDLRLYLQLDHEGANPLNLARAAIDGELERYAHQQSYETLSELQLHDIVEHAFDKLSSRATGGMRIVRAHRFSLEGDPDYINLGPRTLTIAGTLATSDYYARDYEITVELEIVNPGQFVRLTRQGNDPLNHVRAAIKGAIQRAADGQTHEDLSNINLHQVAHSAFTSAPDSTICGLKIIKAHNVTLKVDPRIQERADIEHQTLIEEARIGNQARLTNLENKLDFENASDVLDQERSLSQKQHEKEKDQYLFDIEKDSVEEAHRLRKALSQWIYSQFVEHAGEALQANIPVQNIVKEMSDLSRALQSGLPQISEPPANKQLSATNVASGPDPAQDGAVPPETVRIEEVPSSSVHYSRVERPEVGLTLVEVTVHPTLRPLLDEQERAFQIRKVSAGGPAQIAGLQKGDFLVEMNGQNVYTAEAIKTALDSLQVNNEMEVLVLREGNLKTLTLALPGCNVDQEQEHLLSKDTASQKQVPGDASGQ